ncbi:hypothetical protein GCM10027027_00270 [Neomicrococcus lactis]|uniref:DUF732 domain-containing protein n=1 Tax=Neomicrococcus lactis TaxID=732241 RepID=A0A7W8YAQ1_9MICC|nr:hypothetical protein [Neomicrococcus lactis]
MQKHCFAGGVGLAFVAFVASASSAAPKLATDSTRPSNYAGYESQYGDWRSNFIEWVRKYGGDAKVAADNEGIVGAIIKGRPTSKDGLDQVCVSEVGAPPELPPSSPEFWQGMYAVHVESGGNLDEALRSCPQPKPREAEEKGQQLAGQSS